VESSPSEVLASVLIGVVDRGQVPSAKAMSLYSRRSSSAARLAVLLVMSVRAV